MNFVENTFTPLISVIVPVYNTELYLGRCIESIQRQEYSRFEIIIIDDGSTDDSGIIADKYSQQDERIDVLHVANMGAISARIVGVNYSRGEYIAFVDSDDWIESNMLNMLVDPFLKYNDVDISVSPHNRIDGGTENTIFVMRQDEIWSGRDALINMYSNRWFSWTLCGKLYRRELFDGIEIKQIDNAYGEDIEWNAKLFRKARKVSYQSEIFYHYLQHLDSMVHNFGDPRRLISIERMNAILDLYANIDDDIVQVMSKLICMTGVYNLLDVMQYNEEITERELYKYQHIIHEASLVVTDKLSGSQERCLNYSLMKIEDFRIKYHEMSRRMVQECKKFCADHNKVFIYGAGKIADEINEIMKKSDLDFEGFVVSQEVDGIHRNKKIRCYKDVILQNGDSCGFIVGLNENNKCQVANNLNKMSVPWIDAGKYSLYY